jgi:flagellar motor switch protein FliG
MTPSSQTLSFPLTGPRKAAVFLMGVGDVVSAEVLRHLTKEEVHRLTAEIADTPAVGGDVMLAVFREFESLTEEGRLFTKGGADRARRLVEHAFGPESAQKLLAEKTETHESRPDLLETTDPRQLAMFLKDEHPQTIAVVLSNISPAAAGGLLKSLPEDLQSQVAVRLASLDRVSPDVFAKVADAIGAKLKTIRKITQADGVKTLATLLNHVDPERADAILTGVEEQNQTVADSVRSLMFVFDDVLRIGKEDMKTLVGKLDRKVLTMALKGVTPKIREHFTQCMSQRAAEMMGEDMEALGPVRIRDVENGQKTVIAVIRQLQAEGAISASRSGGGDQYVV